ncbi:Stage II sporulation protein E (SpoIIE) [Stieleria varia]|uniref:Stage II sporulation protein E (SpoIIE) n=2 Tax=Stieleria varia TaxID=2528005 RepID=A0A5C6B919_9BACT|nr:Stage II sporulation protein E (SpoIIE) [Stieleria varia]
MPPEPTNKSWRYSVHDSKPPYLRVHHGPRPSATQRPVTPNASEQFWTAYSAVTGWRVDRPGRGEHVTVRPAIEWDMIAGPDDESLPAVSQSKAQMLADCAAEMSREIDELKAVIRRQEAELAARASVLSGPDAQIALADQVEATLQQAIAACGFDAAAIYLLDDDTQFLKARAVVGLPSDRLENKPRALRGSRADLEAMVQNVVLIEKADGGVIDTWKCPEKCGSAICAALMKGDLPIGTLWLFSSRETELSDADSAIAKMTATQLTLQLSAAASERRERLHRVDFRSIRDIAHWQHAGLPTVDQIAQGWKADGMLESPLDWATGWHTWDILPDGTMMIAMAEADDKSAAGAMVAATARAALTAHCGYRHTPLQLMQRINDTLWQSSTADQLLSMLYARLDVSSGEGELVVAGNISAIVGSRFGYRPLADGKAQPLASALDINAFSTTFHLSPGEILLAYGSGVAADGISQCVLGEAMKRSAEQGNLMPLPAIRRAFADYLNENERGLMTLSRLAGHQ